MREIKFRVWNKKEKRFLDYERDNISINLNGELLEAYDVGIQDTLPYKNYDVMQYIGIKDKNGKYIYEGDVLLRELGVGFDSPSPLVIEFDDELASCGCCFGPFTGSGFVALDSTADLSEMEIIGNIYENPELMEK